jgi:hypothetical protein
MERCGMSQAYKDFIIAKYNIVKIMKEFCFVPMDHIVMSPSGEAWTFEQLEKEYHKIKED